MPVRQAKYNDLPAIYSMVAEGFIEEGLNVVVFPHRHEYPDHYRRAWRHKLREYYWDYSKIFVVSCGVDESGKEMIQSTAIWTRQGDGWENLWGIKGWLDPRLLITHVIKTVHRIHRLLFRNIASVQPTPSHPRPLTFWTWESAVIHHVAHFFTPPSPVAIATGQIHTIRPPTTSSSSSAPNPIPVITPSPNPPASSASTPPFWELSVLTTRPPAQGHGHGRALAHWGLQRARAAGLPAMVVAAEHKERFYQRCGFACLVGWATEGVGNPLPAMGVGGGAILWTADAPASGVGESDAGPDAAVAATRNSSSSSDGSFTVVEHDERQLKPDVKGDESPAV